MHLYRFPALYPQKRRKANLLAALSEKKKTANPGSLSHVTRCVQSPLINSNKSSRVSGFIFKLLNMI
jgi:hypothetical protein